MSTAISEAQEALNRARDEWYEALPEFPADGQCIAIMETQPRWSFFKSSPLKTTFAEPCTGHADDTFYKVEEGHVAWEGVGLHDDGAPHFYGRGWDAFGDADHEFSYIICETCMTAYKLPEEADWT